MNIFRYFIILSLLLFIGISNGKITTVKRSTTYSKCSKSSENINIIVAMETLSEKFCQAQGKKKAEQYTLAGWKCLGKNNEDLYSCEDDGAASYAFFNGVKLDHLTFTNKQKHRSLVAYLKPGSNKICHEDQAELISAGVKDAVCHMRDSL
jgi:hypothetical protein